MYDVEHVHTDRLCLRRQATAEQAAGMLAACMADWERDGIGCWTAAQGCGEQVLGLAGVRRTGEQAEGGRAVFNLYYRFRPSAWGKGYARETGAAAIEAAAGRTEPGLVRALIREGNTASIRVAAALGPAADGTVEHHGSASLRFALAVGGGNGAAQVEAPAQGAS
jgi:RimJ/RimL family protein N-acetyltransferase